MKTGSSLGTFKRPLQCRFAVGVRVVPGRMGKNGVRVVSESVAEKVTLTDACILALR